MMTDRRKMMMTILMTRWGSISSVTLKAELLLITSWLPTQYQFANFTIIFINIGTAIIVVIFNIGTAIIIIINIVQSESEILG